MSTPPLLDTTALRTAGREPAMPCRVALADGREIELLHVLRILPGKRLVAEGRLNGLPVLAKLFIADGAERHVKRERDGITALLAAGIATPEIITETTLQGGGKLLATRFLPHAVSLAECWDSAPRPAGDPVAIALIAPVFALLARMHSAGLTQSDLHLGNFLLDGADLLVIDGDAVERHAGPLSPSQATANLAILLAQLQPAWDAHAALLLTPYDGSVDTHRLSAEIVRVRDWRLNDLLGKSVRDCSLFAVRHTFTRFESVVRDSNALLAGILADPDTAIARGAMLKAGNSATVARVDLTGHPSVAIKRYNLKSVSHALSRMFRRSRAWHAWQAAIRLRFLGVATPRPLALVEERWGPLRRRAWLLTDYCAGESLDQLLCAEAPPPDAIAERLVAIFSSLRDARITHGDLKASNLLWDGEALQLIDLDATTAHRKVADFTRSWQRDRTRLLRNWPAESVLVGWLDKHLPA